jgi:hypothetical protein
MIEQNKIEATAVGNVVYILSALKECTFNYLGESKFSNFDQVFVRI